MFIATLIICYIGRQGNSRRDGINSSSNRFLATTRYMSDFDTPIAASNFAPRNYVPPNCNMSCNYNNCYEPPAYENQPRELMITLDINFWCFTFSFRFFYFLRKQPLRAVLKIRSSETFSQSPWKILMRKFISSKVTG